MEKTITYKGNEYKAVIIWSGHFYMASINGSQFKIIDINSLTDLTILKKELVKCIEYRDKMNIIDEWDGVI